MLDDPLSMLAAIDARMSAQLALLDSLDEENWGDASAQDPSANDSPLRESPVRGKEPRAPASRGNEALAGTPPEAVMPLATDTSVVLAATEDPAWQPHNEGTQPSLLAEMDRIAANYSAFRTRASAHPIDSTPACEDALLRSARYVLQVHIMRVSERVSVCMCLCVCVC